MRLSISGVFADAGAMWRGERQILSALAGMFFVLPILGILFLMAQSGLPADRDPAKLNEAIRQFYGENLLWFLLANLMIDFGTFAVFHVFLRPGQRTLGESLALASRQLLPLIAVDLIASIAFGLSASLFILPGLFVFARTWLAVPALVAQPGIGILGAFREGWQRSDRLRWLVLLGAFGAAILGAVFVILLGSVLLGLASAVTGDNRVLEAAGYGLIAGIGGFVWITLVLVRVSAYRRSEPKQGI